VQTEHKDNRSKRPAVNASDDELNKLPWVAKGCHASLPMGKSHQCRLRESKRWQELEGEKPHRHFIEVHLSVYVHSATGIASDGGVSNALTNENITPPRMYCNRLD